MTESTEAPNPPRARTSGGFARAWTLFRVRGVPIRIDPSWLLIAALAVWIFASRLDRVLGEFGTVVVVGAAAAAALLFFASVLAHELGHALTSLDRGIPVRSITLFMLGGVTESTREARSAKDEFVIVGIGPFISLVLAAAFGLIYTGVQGIAVPAAIAGYLAWTNLILAIFNVIPGYPLDGGRLLRSILWHVSGRPHAATRWAARVGQAFAAVLIAGGLWGVLGGSVPPDIPYVARVILRGGLWQVLIGFFLFRGASEAYGNATARERLTGRTARELMGSVPPELPPDLTLDEALVRVQERPSLLWPVGAPVVGGLTLAQIDEVPQDLWPSTSVRDVAHAAESVSISADEALDVVLERLPAAPGGMLIVVDGGRAVGLVTPSLVAGLAL